MANAGGEPCANPCAPIEHYDPNTRGASKDDVEVQADGRTRVAVPLIGPTQQPGPPWRIALFALPSPRARATLIAEPARTAVAGLN